MHVTYIVYRPVNKEVEAFLWLYVRTVCLSVCLSTALPRLLPTENEQLST